MALVFTDLTKETTSTTGTGTLTLTGAVAKYQSFANIGTGNTTYYRIESGNDSEVGLGTYNGTLSRDTVYMSIIAGVAGTTKITVADGATVSCVYPAERAVYLDAVGNLGIGEASAVNKLTVADTVLATGSAAGSLVDLSQTWNNAAGNPTAIKLNVTNTASGTTSKLMDLQVGGVSKFSVDKNGSVRVVEGSYPATTLLFGTTTNGIGIYSNIVTIIANNTQAAWVSNSTLTILPTMAFSWGNNGVAATDLTLYRDAANTLAQRNGVNSQTQRWYNTYTDASNYERSSLSFVTYSGALYTKLAAESAGTGAANIGIALSPKGTGTITAQVPDGTAAGGNARGANSVDLQTLRNLATQVAGGIGSFGAGTYNTVSSNYSTGIGYGNSVTNLNSFAIGYNNTCGSTSGAQHHYTIGVSNTTLSTGDAVFAVGRECAASMTLAFSFGYRSVSNKYLQSSFGLGSFSSSGDMQYSSLGFAGATANATITEIFLGNAANTRANIPNNTTWAADIDIVARSTSGTENAYFKRRLVIQKGTTAASTALIGTVQTVGTDIGSANMLLIATPITLTADTTNGSLKLEVTGIAATNIRWVAKVSLVEVGFA